MCERVMIYDRCVAIQLQREPPPSVPPDQAPPAYPRETPPLDVDPSKQRSSRFQSGSLRRKRAEEEASKTQPDHLTPGSATSTNDAFPSSGLSPPMSSNSSGTPTPTNGVPPLILGCNSTPQFNPRDSFNSYQEGYHLFRCWVATNTECVWDPELVRAVNAAHFIGFLVGGFILVGGPPRVMAAIIHAHSRALLNAPHGWVIVVLGELRECEVSVVQKGQFTPLGDALCWAIHRLSKRGAIADQKGIHASLLTHFPAMAPPEPALVHAALSDLIRQRKVFHTGRGYGIVQADTYRPEPTSPQSANPARLPPRLLTTSEALTKAHGAAETEKVGDVTHIAVQTDLADLLAGIWPHSSIRTARPPPDPLMLLQRSGSFREDAKSLSSILGERDRGPWQAKYQMYQAHDTSDVAIKGGEKGSMISKLLRVSPRRRLASFSAQFPPPEWTDPKAVVKHSHSVATQTRSSRHPGGPETCWTPHAQWAPRSSTLPRRPSKAMTQSPASVDIHHRPHSTSPSPAKMPYSKVNPAQQDNGRKLHRHNPSQSSPSCITSSYTTRTSSPSLQSTTPSKSIEKTHMQASRSRSPYIGSSPKHKSSSPVSRSRASHSSNSPIPLNQTSPCVSPLRKPPLSYSPHHSSSKEEKRKKILSLAQAEETVTDDSPSKKQVKADNPRGKHYSPHRHSSNSPIRGKVRVKSPQNAPLEGDAPEARSEAKPPTRSKDKVEDEVKMRHHRNRKEFDQEKTKKSRRPERSSLQLDLSSEVHMNNFRKVVASPQKPEGLKNNVFHENLSSIAKGSVSDLTSKNLGYTDINKCDKRLYADETHKNVTSENEVSKSPNQEQEQDQTRPEVETPKLPIIEEKRRLKLSLPLSETTILSEGSLNKMDKKIDRRSLICPDNKTDPLKDKIILSPLDDIHSIKTYPSLSELNMTFSSLAAQKILQGVSVNSIDTLVEVNMIAADKKKQPKPGVTNTDFGFV